VITDPAIAREIADVIHGVSNQLDDSLQRVQDKLPPEEFAAYRLAVGAVLGEALMSVLNPIYAAHPELKPRGFK
jgi:hypothetical protein